MNKNYIDYEFHYASFKLVPYNNDVDSSSHLLRNIIKTLNDENFPSEKKVIDRHKKRKNTPKREIVNIKSRLERKGLRCFGKIALIKNKAPMVWDGKDIIEEINKEENKEFIEVTNYIIHFNENSDPVIMFEYNHEGPRLSDIEFYFRKIAKEFNLAKYISSSLHLDTEYDKLDKELENVFGVTVKLNVANANKTGWLKRLKTISDDSGFKDIRLELFFKRRKKDNGKYEKNIKGLDFSRGIIGWLKKDNNNIEYVDDLKMTYQTSESEEIIDLDFLKNKKTSLIRTEIIDGFINNVEFKSAIAEEFNHFLNTGKTRNEIQ